MGSGASRVCDGPANLDPRQLGQPWGDGRGRTAGGPYRQFSMDHAHHRRQIADPDVIPAAGLSLRRPSTTAPSKPSATMTANHPGPVSTADGPRRPLGSRRTAAAESAVLPDRRKRAGRHVWSDIRRRCLPVAGGGGDNYPAPEFAALMPQPSPTHNGPRRRQEVLQFPQFPRGGSANGGGGGGEDHRLDDRRAVRRQPTGETSPPLPPPSPLTNGRPAEVCSTSRFRRLRAAKRRARPN